MNTLLREPLQLLIEYPVDTPWATNAQPQPVSPEWVLEHSSSAAEHDTATAGGCVTTGVRSCLPAQGVAGCQWPVSR